MPSKKKPKPSYSVPEDLKETPQSGWVYRSGSPDPEDLPPSVEVRSDEKPEAAGLVDAAAPAAASSAATPSTSGSAKVAAGKSITSEIIELAANAVSSGAAALGNVILLGARLATAPISIGLKMIGLRK